MSAQRNSDPLAIHGGAPVRTEAMPMRGAMGPTEIAKVQEVLAYYQGANGDPCYQGVFETEYTERFVAMHGGGYADAVATGTVSLYVALAALELPPASEVLVSPITDPGSISAIIKQGLVPRLVDAAPGSYGIDAEQVAKRITPKTSCVMVVHAAGRACDIEAIVALAHARGIKVLEDCSQAHYARWNGKPVGTFGDVAAFSTMYRKAHMTGASGGIVYSRNEHIHRLGLAHADRGKPRWDASFDDRNPGNYLFPALNLHTDEISCAIGIASLERLPDTIAKRMAYLKGVADGLKAANSACQVHAWSAEDSPFYIPVFIDMARLTVDKVDFAKAIIAEGIPLNPDYRYVVAEWAWMKPYLADDFTCPNAVKSRSESFCLYVNEMYGAREVEDTLAAIAKVEKALCR